MLGDDANSPVLMVAYCVILIDIDEPTVQPYVACAKSVDRARPNLLCDSSSQSASQTCVQFVGHLLGEGDGSDGEWRDGVTFDQRSDASSEDLGNRL